MPSDTRGDIRRLLHEAASDLPVLAPEPGRTVRRARRRIASTVSILLIVAGLAIGGAWNAAKPFQRSQPAAPSAATGAAWVVDVRTGAATKLAGVPDGASWFTTSADGGAIAFAADHGKDLVDHSQVYVMAADGTGLRQVTHDPYQASQPALSPDGSRLAYVGFGSGTSRNVFVVGPDGRVRQLTHEKHDVGSLAWSPDGSSILYSAVIPNKEAPFGFNGEHIVLKEVGATTGRVTALVGNERSSAAFGTWSPDGHHIAYMAGPWNGGSYGFDRATIWLMNADGSNRHRLVSPNGHALELAWSPQGNLLAFSVVEGGGFATYVADVSTSQIRRVTTGGFPVWLDPHTLIVQR